MDPLGRAGEPGVFGSLAPWNRSQSRSSLKKKSRSLSFKCVDFQTIVNNLGKTHKKKVGGGPF